MSDASIFAVTLHHLAPDVARAAKDLPDVELSDVTPDKLRKLLEALSALAPKVEYPAAPEMRIAAAEGRFLVQVKEGKVRFTSWSLRTGGSDLTPAQILAAITGEPLDERAGTGAAGGSGGKRISRVAKVALLAAVILGSNSVTAWMMMRPPPELLLPPYRLLDPEPAQRLFERVAGTYETGTTEGDRRLTIARDGVVHWGKFGTDGTLIEDTLFTAKAAESKGQPALFTTGHALIEIKDPVTVVFYGDTFRRKTP